MSNRLKLIRKNNTKAISVQFSCIFHAIFLRLIVILYQKSKKKSLSRQKPFILNKNVCESYEIDISSRSTGKEYKVHGLEIIIKNLIFVCFVDKAIEEYTCVSGAQ